MATITQAEFWNRAARKYAKGKMSNPDAYEAGLARVFAHLRPDDRVLEMGCGSGATALRLAEHTAHVTASDISSEMIAVAHERVAEHGAGNVTPVTGVIGEAGLDGPFDTILAFNLLHLDPELNQTLAQVHAQLPQGGLFISKTPCIGETKAWLKPIIAVMQWVGKAPWVRFFKIAELETQIRAAGFSLIETGDYPKSTPAHLVVARKT